MTKTRASIFDAEMNARLVKDAEGYYRSMFYGRDESWNRRDTHFFEMLVRLMKQIKGLYDPVSGNFFEKIASAYGGEG